MKKTINYRSFLASAAVMLTFTALTAACDQEQPKVKTAQIAPAKEKAAPGLLPAAPAKSVEESLSFLPDPVAIIGNKKISKAEFIKKLGNIPPELIAQMPKNLLIQQFKMAIDNMVNEYLLVLSAEKAGIKPSKELAVSEFDKKLKALPAAQLETLKQELAKQGKSIDDLKKEFTTNPEDIKMTAVNYWIERDLKGKLKVTDAEVTKYYNANKATAFNMPRTVKTAHILISGSDTPGTAADPAKDKAAKEKAEALLAQIRKGADFGTIAQKESKCGSAQVKGELGELSQNQLVPEYFNAAFALKPGEISNVVKSPFGYHIIKLHSKKEATTLPLDAKLKTAIKEKITSDKLEKQIQAYIKAQKTAMKVIIPPFKGEEAAAKKPAPAAKKAAPAAKKAK